MSSPFREELCHLINRFSRENGSDTPDLILAQYLEGCLLNFDTAVVRREVWYGRKTGAVTKEVELCFEMHGSHTCHFRAGHEGNHSWVPPGL